MALPAFFMCFAILLKAGYSQTKPTATVLSHYNATPIKYVNVSTCEWNCVILSKGFSKEMKILMKESKLITLEVKYDEKVDQRCLDQSYIKTLKKPDSWIWLTAAGNSEAKQSSGYSSSTSAPKPFTDNISLKRSQEGYKEVNVSCGFEPGTRNARNSTSRSFDNQLITLLLIESIASSSGDLQLGSLCYAETKHNPYICLNISKTGNNSETELDFGKKMFDFAFSLTTILILVVFSLYSPAILCLFPATEDTDRHGARQIILEGPSPVGVRNLVAKFLNPKMETIWRKLLKFMLLIAIFPALIKILPCGSILTNTMFQPSILICSYFFFMAFGFFCRLFFPTKSFKEKYCFACWFVQREVCFRQCELLEMIISHLGVQPLLFANCWKLFTRSLFRYVQIVSLVLPCFEVSLSTFFQGLLFISIVLTIPLVTIILFLRSIITFIFAFLTTTPTFSVAGYGGTFGFSLTLKIFKTVRPSYVITVAALEFCFNLLATLGAWLTLGLVTCNVGVQSLVATIALVEYSAESLPYVACFVIVVYYLWSCYSSFTNKYRVLALKLFKLHKTHFNQLQQRQDLESEIEPANYNVDTIMRIPKDLFDIACEELLPVRQSVCIMMVKVGSILVFFFLVFSTIMTVPDVTSTTKAMVAFFTGTFPKFLSIFLDGGRSKSLNDVALEEKVSCIVKDYITRSSTLDPVDDEEELVFTNPETAELINLV